MAVAESSDGAGLYARIRVRPDRECVLRRLSEDHTVKQYMPGTPGRSRPQVIIKPAGEAADDLLTAAGIEEIIWLGDRAVCLLRHSETPPLTPESHTCKLALYGFGWLPIAPVAVRAVDGWLELHLVTTAYPELRETVSELRAAAFDVDLRQVVQSDRAFASALDEPTTLSTLDLSVLTERQREAVTVAVEMGYFEETGASAEQTADALGISKSTLSEHLRIVIRKLLSQVIP